MEIKKRCGNCGRYPFCKKTKGASCYCEEWIKRTCEISKEIGVKNEKM